MLFLILAQKNTAKYKKGTVNVIQIFLGPPHPQKKGLMNCGASPPKIR